MQYLLHSPTLCIDWLAVGLPGCCSDWFQYFVCMKIALMVYF